MLLLTNTINILNEKDLKYKVVSEGADISIVFGIMFQGQKSKVELIPGDEVVKTRLLNSEKEISADELPAFVDNILELKALYERETEIFKLLTE